MKEIYLDNSASTPTDPGVLKEMTRALNIYGNPSSFNDAGREARSELEKARLKVARFLGARPEEIVFTSSGSEANNQAVLSAVSFSRSRPSGECLVSPIEHPSVLEPLRHLESNKKIRLKFLKVDSDGTIDLKDLETKLNKNTTLVSVMCANNEIGTIEPIKKIGKIIKKFNNKLEIENWKLKINEKRHVFFHVDACQAVECLDISPNHLGADLLVFNGSKLYGPKGVGVLYASRKVKLTPLIRGGEQERGLRAGTENLSVAVGLAKALELIDKKEGQRQLQLRDYFLSKVKELLPDIRINGTVGLSRLPNNINISIPGLDSENLLLELDKHGIRAGSGSACTSHSVEPSHVLKAIGVEKKYLSGALRFSMGRQTTKGDIDYLLKVLPKIVKDLKKLYSN